MNILANDPEEYFNNKEYFIPFLNSLIRQLNDHFINHKKIISGFQMLIKS